MNRRRAFFIFLSFLAVFLIGTVLVLSSITYYLAIDPDAYLSELEVPLLDNKTRWDPAQHHRTQYVPKIIHQTWKTDTLPPRWQNISQECRDMMPDYEYMLWTDAGSKEFIAKHYPWFLETFEGYKYNIQRADAIRYFVLHHYGGIYIDLDIGCLRPMDPLLTYPVILPKTIPVGVSNDLMISAKGHPFMEQTIHNLVTFDHSWVLNYPTVMFSTGPMFVSAQYGIYASAHPNTASADVRILPKSMYGKNAKEGEAPNSFFSHFYGSSWHADDAAFIAFLDTWGKGLMWLGLLVLILGLLKLPKSQRRYTLGRYDVLLSRLSHRSGRWHLVLGGSTPSTQPSSPYSSRGPSSPIDADVPVFHLPFNVRPSSPASSEASTLVDPYAGRTASPIVEAYQRIRNRVVSITSPHEEYPRTPVRTRRTRPRNGVLFFLPAIFTPSQDMEMEGTRPHDFPRLRSNPLPPPTSPTLLPPEKQRLIQDLECGLGSPTDEHTPYDQYSDSGLIDLTDPPRRSRSRSHTSRRPSPP
ncbi:hypothetical protein D9756_000471 [Leucocoprinus leucothites]|uniref:Glycosyltransferase family 32 protein n=1 Tax=Leucocoprinus leucothites TaxID=201217 RepID=A0A8H5LNR0_9AGAR|nr:hypothetical protein D9756_000471 [Leucoagaricus leucothites]